MTVFPSLIIFWHLVFVSIGSCSYGGNLFNAPRGSSPNVDRSYTESHPLRSVQLFKERERLPSYGIDHDSLLDAPNRVFKSKKVVTFSDDTVSPRRRLNYRRVVLTGAPKAVERRVNENRIKEIESVYIQSVNQIQLKKAKSENNFDNGIIYRQGTTRTIERLPDVSVGRSRPVTSSATRNEKKGKTVEAPRIGTAASSRARFDKIFKRLDSLDLSAK